MLNIVDICFQPSDLFFKHFSPFGIALFGQWETSKGVVSAISKKETITPSIEINNPDEVLRLIQTKERMILDVRQKDSFDQGHLPGALSFPLDEFDENVEDLFAAAQSDSAILVYCSSIECTDSHTFADHLIMPGYTDVKVFSGGFRQWQEMEYKIEKNEE